jgi:nucleotide-binding universal stress UspA family protein
MFGRILVAVDGSEASDKALRRSIQGARILGKELHLISVSERSAFFGAFGGGGEEENLFRRGIERVLERERAIAEAAGVEIAGVHIFEGNAAEEIVRHAEETGYDYIVLGRRGEGLAMRFRLGSTTHKVVTYAPCPVVVVPRREDPESDLGRILVAVDGSESSDKALARAIELAAAWERSLHVVAVAERLPAYVTTSGEADVATEHQRRNLSRVLEKAGDRARASGVEVEATHLLDGNPADAIVGLAEKMGYDFIVLGRRGQGLSRRFRLGSTTHKVISYAPCMVVVVPRRDPPRPDS